MVYIFLVMSLFLRVLSRMILNIMLTVLGFSRESDLQVRTTDSFAFTYDGSDILMLSQSLTFLTTIHFSLHTFYTNGLRNSLA